MSIRWSCSIRHYRSAEVVSSSARRGTAGCHSRRNGLSRGSRRNGRTCERVLRAAVPGLEDGTYRVDLSKNESRIQGWSQIDNPTGESWDNVDLTLVSGMPTSFTMNLYQPLYASRQSVPVPSSVVVGPRQYEATLETAQNNIQTGSAQVVDQDRIIDGFSNGVLPSVGGRGGAAAPGVLGGVLGGVLKSQQAAAPPPPPSQTADVSHVDDYFEYRFPFPVQLATGKARYCHF